MKKRFTFQCWNCQRSYSLYREITPKRVITVACPFCGREAVFDPNPYPAEKVILRNAGEAEAETEELVLPEVLSTRKPDSAG